MLRPRSVPTMLRHVAWRMKNLVRSQRQPESSTYRAMEWFRKPGEVPPVDAVPDGDGAGTDAGADRVPCCRPCESREAAPARHLGRDPFAQRARAARTLPARHSGCGRDHRGRQRLGRRHGGVPRPILAAGLDRAQPAAAGVRRGGESRHPARALLACVRAEQRHARRAWLPSGAAAAVRDGPGSVLLHRADLLPRGPPARGDRQDRDESRARCDRVSGALRRATGG